MPAEPKAPLEKVREELLFTAAAPINPAEEAQYVQGAEEKFRRRHPSYTGLSLHDVFVGQFAHANAVATWQLGELAPEPRTMALLKSLLSSPSPTVKQAAATALLRLGEPEALAVAVEIIGPAPEPTHPVWSLYEGEPELLQAIRAFENDDPEAIAALSVMLKHPNVEVRRAALEALSQVPPGSVRGAQKRLRAAVGVPFLVQALDDEDVWVRFDAMSRLAQITGIDIRRPPWPSGLRYGSIQRLPWMGAMRNGATPNSPTDEKKYLDFWKQWWLAEGKPVLEAANAASK